MAPGGWSWVRQGSGIEPRESIYRAAPSPGPGYRAGMSPAGGEEGAGERDRDIEKERKAGERERQTEREGDGGSHKESER